MLLETILYGVYLIERHIGQRYSEGFPNKTEEGLDTVCQKNTKIMVFFSCRECSDILTLLHLLPYYSHSWVD